MTTFPPVPPTLPSATDAGQLTPLGDALILPAAPQPLVVAVGQSDVPAPAPDVVPTPSGARTNGGHRATQAVRPTDRPLPAPTPKDAPSGPILDKDGLLVHASGRISEIYGPRFAVQDSYRRQTRMPEPPLLLADRLLGIDAEQGTPGTGTVWTETDVPADAWWLHNGRMPAGIMVESGQADLMLISWMGADFANKGDRVYRLLGCELTFLGGLPEIGDTLSFDIHVDGHASQGAVRLFFFSSDCTIDGVVRLSVRNGQAGFFSDDELAASGGILWNPKNETVTGRLDPPPCPTSRKSLSRNDLAALSAGQIWQTLGDGFENAAGHTRTPSIPSGPMLILDEVTDIDFTGGPWGRGYLRAVQHVTPETWFFAGHFKDDPCMPGTLMAEGTLQAMALYMTAAGLTLTCDAWRFEPVPFETFKLKCRGQVTPASREVVYEVFVRELSDSPEPTLFADVLCTVDGLAAFHGSRMGLKLSPGWPMDQGVAELENHTEPVAVAEADGFAFDYASLLACGWGKPSRAFGPRYERFDTHRKVARLPGPPYHFMSRITEVGGEFGAMKAGARAVVEYDVPTDAWYFAANGAPTMPNAVLMEAALQPCGWLASYAGCSLSTDVDLYFRNLDGTGVQHLEVTPTTGTVRTEVQLTSVAKMGNTIIVKFEVEMYIAAALLFSMETTFGYFTDDALKEQRGLPTTDAQRALLEQPSSAQEVHLNMRAAEYFGSGARLAEPKLLMIDRVTGRWPTAGAAGLGRWRGVKSVDPAEWFFKAHFFQDPVQPGSLGIEALLSLLQFAMLDLGLGAEAGPDCYFEPLALGETTTWRYRGQVRPKNKLITSFVEITRIERGDSGILAVADATLWVDGLPIYSAEIGMRIKAKPTAAGDADARVTAVKEATSAAAHGVIRPSQVQVRDGHVSCPNLPLERVRVTHGADDGAAQAILTTDWQPVRTWWLDRLSEEWRRQENPLVWTLLERYVRHVIVTDPAGIERVAGRSVLLLANHQLMLESILGTIVASWVTGTTVVTVSHEKQRHLWVGELARTFGAEDDDLRTICYFDPSRPADFFTLLDDVKRDIATRGSSFMVHPTGTRQWCSRERPSTLTSTLLDMAVEVALPIVPVHFAGGLPEESVGHKFELPYRHAAQDYIFGTPIMPDELAGLPYALRRKHVLDAINALAPASDAPHEPNLAVEARVRAAAPNAAPLEEAEYAIRDALGASSRSLAWMHESA